MHCTSQYTKDTNNILSNYLIFHIFGAFSSKNIIFLLQILQTYEELKNLIEYFLYLLYIAMYNAY